MLFVDPEIHVGSSQFIKMNSFDGFFSRTSSFTFGSLFDITPISDAQKYHLTKVYSTLAFSSLITFITVAIAGPWRFIHPILGIFFLLCSSFYIFLTKSAGNEVNLKSFLALSVFSMSLGLIHRGYIRFIFDLRPDLVNTALMCSVGIFASFSLSSLFLESRSWLYLGGLLFSITWYVGMVEFVNLFIKSTFVWNITLILCLLVLVGYVAFDTQLVLKSVESNTHDVVKNALLLYIDLFSLFLKILEYLVKKEVIDNKDKEKE